MKTDMTRRTALGLLPLLKDIDGIVYATNPCFYIDWENMTIPKNQQLVALANYPKGCSVAQIELWGVRMQKSVSNLSEETNIKLRYTKCLYRFYMEETFLLDTL